MSQTHTLSGSEFYQNFKERLDRVRALGKNRVVAVARTVIVQTGVANNPDWGRCRGGF